MRTLADYNDIFMHILSECLGFSEDNILLSQYENGADSSFIDESGDRFPFSPKDNWCVYRYNQVSTYIVDDEARVYYDLHVNLIGEECDKYVTRLKLLLEKQKMLDYYALNEIGIESTNVPVVTSNVIINREWFQRRMLRLRFNFIESLDEPIEDEYIDKIDDIEIKEV